MIKCFYHSKDLDGKCSGAIVLKKFPRCKLIGLDYGDPFPWEEVTKSDTIYMVDLALDDFDQLFRIEDSCKKFILVDHHTSTLNNMSIKKRKLKNAHVDLSMAGCEATWKLLFPEIKMPESIRLIGRYDIWDHKDHQVIPFNTGLQVYNSDPESYIWSLVLNTNEYMLNNFIEETIELGEQIEKYQAIADQWTMKFSFETEWEGIRFVCVNNARTGSRQFESKFNSDKHDAVLVFYRTPHKKWSIHMYTEKEDIDLSVIATKYGGGGHRNACGCELDELPF